jgi:predicted acyl esterase
MTAQSTAIWHALTIERDVEIPLRDGSHVVADVFRPDAGGGFGTIMTLGPYSKDIHFQDWSRDFDYATLPEKGPYMHWETVNPEWWVPQGYVVVRVDGRGTGKSPGRVRRLSEEEAQDFHDCIEWAAAQPWSNGRVAVMGISYFAINAWRVAASQPLHLACIVPWEGAVDTYRDAGRHGGIYSNNFNQRWSSNVRRHAGQAANDAPPAPPELDGQPAFNAPDLSRIQVPVLSAGNWGGVGLHLRGNTEGFLGAASRHKMLQIHSDNHVIPFYSEEGRLTQKRWLDQWLYGIDTGVLREPPVKLAIRYGGDRYVWRYENEWPIARTRWTPWFLQADGGTLSQSAAPTVSTVSYQAEPDSSDEASRVVFALPAVDGPTEFTGPAKLKLWISSTADDADLFVIVRKLDEAGNEVRFPAQNGPAIPAAIGWLRASHRKLDEARSLPYRPWHTHDELEKLEPDEIVPVEVEIWPTSVVLETGERLSLEIGARDDPGLDPFLHNHPVDRIQNGRVTIYAGGEYDSHLLLPLIPAR